MADGSKIEWTEATWNPLRGCSRISEGCRFCYAETVAARFSDPGMPYEGLAKRTPAGPRWTGKVKLIPEHLDDPIRWTRPRRIFVNSMSDLFHESLHAHTDIAPIFTVMHKAPRHTYQLLTKRAARMRAFFESGTGKIHGLNGAELLPPNIWLGVSVEDQAAADDRIPFLLSSPAKTRWLSCEPLIGPVSIPRSWLRQLSWVVVGGESGHGARPFDIGWARSLVADCHAAGVAVFVKQLGARPVYSEKREVVKQAGKLPGGGSFRMFAASFESSGSFALKDRKGGDWSEWPEDLRVREYPRAS